MEDFEAKDKSLIDLLIVIKFSQMTQMKGLLCLSQSKSNNSSEKLVSFSFFLLPFYTHGSGVTFLMLIIVTLMRVLSLSYVTHSFVH